MESNSPGSPQVYHPSLPPYLSLPPTPNLLLSKVFWRAMPDGKKGRRRRSSSLIYHEPLETMEQLSDQSALPNLNANWVNAKGEFHFFYDCEAVLVHLLS